MTEGKVAQTWERPFFVMALLFVNETQIAKSVVVS